MRHAIIYSASDALNQTRAFDFSIGDWLKAKAGKETPAEPLHDGDNVKLTKEPGA